MEKPIYVSAEGLEKMKQELLHLKTDKSREVADRIEKAKDMGDLSENAEYDDAKAEYAWVQGRISELTDALNRAQVIEATDNDEVSLGCRVTVLVNGKEKAYELVGVTEADPFKGKISNESPIGQALLGLAVDEEVEVEAPSGPLTYRIKSIEC
jgi:transcription elongation factor GreA